MSSGPDGVGRGLSFWYILNEVGEGGCHCCWVVHLRLWRFRSRLLTSSPSMFIFIIRPLLGTGWGIGRGLSFWLGEGGYTNPIFCKLGRGLMK